MKHFLFVCLLLCLFQFCSLVINASSCVEHFVPLIARYSRADSVFIGKIKNIKQVKTPSELENFNEKYRSVKFEPKKIYKGLEVSTKEFSLLNVSESGDYETEKLKIGQIWIVFVRKDEGKLYFGGGCDASRKIEEKADIDYYEKEILSVKDKQAIIGRIVDEMTFEKLKDIEVVLEGNGMKEIKLTDEEGLFYFPIQFPGSYKISINLPFYGLPGGYNSGIKTIDIRESEDKSLPPTKTIFIYEIILKERSFNYDEINVFVMPKKK